MHSCSTFCKISNIICSPYMHADVDSVHWNLLFYPTGLEFHCTYSLAQTTHVADVDPTRLCIS